MRNFVFLYFLEKIRGITMINQMVNCLRSDIFGIPNAVF
jgi:hypothetical protein